VASPSSTRAQRGERVRRIGVLKAAAESDPDSKVRAATVREALQELGWIEGRNLRIEWQCKPNIGFNQSTKSLCVPCDARVADGKVTLAGTSGNGSVPSAALRALSTTCVSTTARSLRKKSGSSTSMVSASSGIQMRASWEAASSATGHSTAQHALEHQHHRRYLRQRQHGHIGRYVDDDLGRSRQNRKCAEI
jgi:hypothetical protein